MDNSWCEGSVKLAPARRVDDKVSKKGSSWAGFPGELTMETKGKPFHNSPRETDGSGADRMGGILAIQVRQSADCLAWFPLICTLRALTMWMFRALKLIRPAPSGVPKKLNMPIMCLAPPPPPTDCYYERTTHSPGPRRL